MARELSIEIHKLVVQLPKSEQYRQGDQLLRSIRSVRSNIVEGYGRKRYPRDYIRFIIYALASNDESIDHLEILHEIGEIKNPKVYETLKKKMIQLGVKLNNFLKALERDQRNLKEPMVFYEIDGPAPSKT